MHKVNIICAITLLMLAINCNKGFANETQANKESTDSVTAAKKSKAPVIIRSQVKGSQEQPKVIYILPWQGVNKVIEVEGKKRTIKLPQFQPINPRTFKQQVKLFSAQQELAKPVVNKE